MPRPKRKLRSVNLSVRVTEDTSKKLVKKCERMEITISDYIDRLIKKDLK